MKIGNYDNRRINVDRLRDEGHSEAFILGASGGMLNDTSQRPKKPEAALLQVRNVADGMIEIYGLTYPYRQELKRLGGKWSSEAQSWRFPSTRIAEIRGDSAINPHVWVGVPQEHMAEALKQWEQQCLEYGEGYQYGQQMRDRIPLDKAFPRRHR